MKLTRKNFALSRSVCILTAVILALVATSSHADIAVNIMRTLDDRLVTAEGICTNADLYEAYPARVFPWTFDSKGSGSSAYFFQNHPALTAADSGNGDSLYSSDFQYLPANTAVHFAFDTFNLSGNLTNLAYWDGNGEINFSAISDGTTMSVTQGPESAVLDGSAVDVDGFDITTTSDGGGVHSHPGFTVTGDGFAPAEGVYLWCMEISMPGMQTTDPFFVVMNTAGIQYTALDDAEIWVNSNIGSLTAVPEPSCWVLLGSVGLGLVWFGRRKRSRQEQA